ncbi:MAG: IS66-like element accessory protein TnpA [Methylocystis sp.]
MSTYFHNGHSLMSLDDQASSIKGHKRRSWTIEEKRRIVEESLEPGASIAKVARRYNMNANQLCTWRRYYGVQPATMQALASILPVTVEPEVQSTTTDVSTTTSQMEIVLAEGDRIIVWSDVEMAALSRVLKTLSQR